MGLGENYYKRLACYYFSILSHFQLSLGRWRNVGPILKEPSSSFAIPPFFFPLTDIEEIQSVNPPFHFLPATPPPKKKEKEKKCP